MSLHSQHYSRSSDSDKVGKAMVCVCTQAEWTGLGQIMSIDVSALTIGHDAMPLM